MRITHQAVGRLQKLDKIMNDFKLIKTEEDYKKYEQQLKDKGGIFGVQIVNPPSEFPVLITYSYSNDINGRKMVLKHITKNNLVKVLQEIS